MSKYRLVQVRSNLDEYPYEIQRFVKGFTKTIKADHFWQSDTVEVVEDKWITDWNNMYEEGIRAYNVNYYTDNYYAIFKTLEIADKYFAMLEKKKEVRDANKAFTLKVVKELND